jgi:hypothetical protein
MRAEKRAGVGFPDLEAEAAQNTAQAILNVAKFCLHEFARGQQRASLLRFYCLVMHWAEPAEADQFRDPARVAAVGLDRHDLERIARLDGTARGLSPCPQGSR